MAEHRTLTGDSLHEPKGADTATVGQVYTADGLGSGSWGSVPVDPSGITIERLLDGTSLAASQSPTSVDTPIQLEFGAAQGTGGDPVSLSAAGLLTFNEAGTYRLKISFAYGRTGGAGVSELYFRALVNGTQAGQSIHAKVTDADVYIPFSDEAWLTVPAGITVSYELMRDSSGNNSGGVYSGSPTPLDWNPNPCAAIRVERWSN